MKEIRFDFNNMFSHSIGAKNGATESDIKKISAAAAKALGHLTPILKSDASRVGLGLEWTKLPFQGRALIRKIQKMGDDIADSYENVISLGIGGSYLGLKAAQDALCPAYYNDFDSLRKGRPRIYFDGNNMDPDTLTPLLAHLDPKKTFVVVISKSGETTESRSSQ
jgi:glucose-6-phosphate isomerase